MAFFVPVEGSWGALAPSNRKQLTGIEKMNSSLFLFPKMRFLLATLGEFPSADEHSCDLPCLSVHPCKTTGISVQNSFPYFPFFSLPFSSLGCNHSNNALAFESFPWAFFSAKSDRQRQSVLENICIGKIQMFKIGFRFWIACLNEKTGKHITSQ